MEPLNIISAYQTALLFSKDKHKLKSLSCLKSISLADYEAKTLEKLIDLLRGSEKFKYSITNGYYVGYKIEQISKEFDLLRFSDDSVINIELKSTLSESCTMEKVINQMEKNYFYLKFLNKEIHIFTFIGSTNKIYYYDIEKNCAVENEVGILVDLLNSQRVNYKINPELEFIPSNYLVSPFNLTDKFINDEYFLTDHQINIKKEFINSFYDDIKKSNCNIYCLSGNAGTGKTLLTYDIVKELESNNFKCLVVHCANLNSGQDILNYEHKWNIVPVKNVTIENIMKYNPDLIVVDESQRIYDTQLDIILDFAKENGVSVLFSYDEKQYLHNRETIHGFEEYIKESVEKPIFFKLTNKIRTNKRIESFIKNLLRLNSDNSFFDYSDVSIDYFQDYQDAYEFVNTLKKEEWQAIAFTASTYKSEPIDRISNYSSNNPHKVIGQEFNKVVVIMDSNFHYNDKGVLITQKNYYSAKGMLFQIVTRAINKLKIVVVDNAELYEKIINIKNYKNKSIEIETLIF